MKRFDKKIYILCTLLFYGISVTSCEKAPERAQNKNVEQEIDLTSEQYVSIDEAEKQVCQLEGKQSKGFGFSEHIEMPDGKIAEVKLIPWESEKRENFEKVLENLWSDYNTVDWSAIKRTKRQIALEKNNKKYFGEEYFYMEKEDEKTGIYYSYDASGFFCGDSLDESKLSCNSCIKEYDFEWGDTLTDQDVYQLEDGKLAISEAVSFTENLLNQYLSVMEKGQFTYKVQHLYVVQNEETGCYDYNMSIGRVYQGVFIDTSTAFDLTEGKCYDKVHGGKYILATMRHRNRLDYINMCDELLAVESERVMEKIISPFWAVQQMDQKVAHFGGLNFVDCGLVYLLVQDNQRAKDNVQDAFQGVAYGETSLRPVWLFMSQGNGGMFQGFTNDNHGASVVIDAIDGTLYYYENTGIY